MDGSWGGWAHGHLSAALVSWHSPGALLRHPLVALVEVVLSAAVGLVELALGVVWLIGCLIGCLVGWFLEVERMVGLVAPGFNQPVNVPLLSSSRSIEFTQFKYSLQSHMW